MTLKVVRGANITMLTLTAIVESASYFIPAFYPSKEADSVNMVVEQRNSIHKLNISYSQLIAKFSAVSLSRQRHDILDFSCCPPPRVLLVTLGNLQNFGFEFHLRSSPSAFSAYR